MAHHQLGNDSPRCFNGLSRPPRKARPSLDLPHFLIPRCRVGIEIAKMVAGRTRVCGDAVNTATGGN